jgi:hypothetical protein
MPAKLLPTCADVLMPQDDVIIVDEVTGKNRAYFEQAMAQAIAASHVQAFWHTSLECSV